MSASRITMPRLATIVAVAAVLSIAREVFLPLALAMLIAFAISPPVLFLRRKGLPHLVAVLIVVVAAALAFGAFFLIVATEMGQLARDLPTFQSNILKKFDLLQEAGGQDTLFAHLSRMVAAIGADLSQTMPGAAAPSVAPMQVEVVSQGGTFSLFQSVALALFSPVATVGLVGILVIFMLLEREELRDKFIRLVGSSDLHRTTQVLAEAGHRVGQYLAMQVLVNFIYAVPIGIGLLLIGVPNAILWGLLTLVLRFVPFIGAILAAAFPLALAFAISPDWSAVLWTVALFVTVEMVTSNVVEPWLYASRTGVSPLSIIVAAIFWTWIWGPMGLVMSTPLTVCLVVLGRHIPQFEIFHLLLGGESVLAPYAGLYQRLLVGDAPEATLRAEEALETASLADYYQEVAIPALLLCQNDFGLGSMTINQQEGLAETAMRMVEDLSGVVQEEREAVEAASAARVLCIGGRSRIDDVSAAMLGQVLGADGAVVSVHSSSDLAAARLAALNLSAQDCLILAFLDPAPSRASLLHIRRLKRAAKGLRVGVVIWSMPVGQSEGFDAAPGPARVPPEKLKEAIEIGADFAVSDLAGALAQAFALDDPRPLPEAAPKKPKVRSARAVT